ncbi:hypothetical protein ACQKEK_10085 [Pseudomonas sp. NPDC077408]
MFPNISLRTNKPIETVAQLGKLTELACDQAQGFYLGRPMSPLLFQQVLADAKMASVDAAGVR